MKNYEIYADEIREFKGGNFCRDFVIPHIFKSDNCDHMHCSDCGRHQLLWFMEDCEEREVDWNKVAVDTPILVRDSEDEECRKRYFAKYENGTVYAWGSGRTSWSGSSMTVWNCVKLAESEEE